MFAPLPQEKSPVRNVDSPLFPRRYTGDHGRNSVNPDIFGKIPPPPSQVLQVKGLKEKIVYYATREGPRNMLKRPTIGKQSPKVPPLCPSCGSFLGKALSFLQDISAEAVGLHY